MIPGPSHRPFGGLKKLKNHQRALGGCWYMLVSLCEFGVDVGRSIVSGSPPSREPLALEWSISRWRGCQRMEWGRYLDGNQDGFVRNLEMLGWLVLCLKLCLKQNELASGRWKIWSLTLGTSPIFIDFHLFSIEWSSSRHQKFNTHLCQRSLKMSLRLALLWNQKPRQRRTLPLWSCLQRRNSIKESVHPDFA